MGIYRGAGGSGDAVNDASSEALITIQARDAAIAAQAAAEAAQTAAELAETNAETAETNAETAETNAETAATNAASSASAASTSASNAASSASAASTSATNASNSASAASTSATNASNSASAAATSATNASNSASAASTSASNAATSESNAATSASNAASSYDSFDDRYLGAKSSAPTLDNDGNALLTGALYFNTSTNEMKVWSGSAWLNAYASLSSALLATNNLSDLNNTATARANLGVAIGTNVQAWDADLDTWATKTAPSGTVVGTTDSQALTNKTISGASNTLSNIGNSSLTNSSITINGTATSLGGSISVGTVTSVSATSPVSSSGGNTPTISLASGYGDTQNPYASKTANFFLAAPNGSVGVPSFRAIVAADIPTLNQNTTGTASNVTGTVAIANGGTGASTFSSNAVLLGNGTSSFQTVAPGANGNILTSNGTTWTSVAPTASGSFDAGTRMIFAQTSAPTGWTKDTTNYNNHALRVVTGAASTGGSVDFTTAFTSQAVAGTVGTSGATTLSTSQIPSHTHSYTAMGANWGPDGAAEPTAPTGATTGATGGGGSHTHSGGTFTGTAINLAVKYLDVITATKN